MINRTKIKDSIYDILDEDPKKIQKYIDKEAKKEQKQKDKEKEKRNKKSSIVDVNLQENIDKQEDNPYNKIIIHTEKDNLVHNYFHYFDMYWDAGDCLSSVVLKLPKTNEENTKYWITYTGDVCIYLTNDVNREMHKTNDNVNTYWGLQGAKSIFKGEIGRIKEYHEELEIHIDSIGKRFKQKIPEEFRQAFIYNQNVRDAFQAICEFLGVKYICPPGKGPQQDDDTETPNPSGDGQENDPNQKTQQEQDLADKASQAADQASKAAEDAAKNYQNNESSSDSSQNNSSQTSLDGGTQDEDIQKGYSDISFDANGAIMHGSVVIETSPNVEKELLSIEESPLESFLTDTTFVATDVKKFLDGEMFETVHNNVMNYGAITVQPASSQSSSMSSVSDSSDTGSIDGSSDGNGGSSGSSSGGGVQSLNPGKTRIGLQGVTISQNKVALSYDQVNSMSVRQAQHEATKTDYYYHTTIVRLRAYAAWGRPIGPNTDYSKYYY